MTSWRLDRFPLPPGRRLLAIILRVRPSATAMVMRRPRWVMTPVTSAVGCWRMPGCLASRATDWPVPIRPPVADPRGGSPAWRPARSTFSSMDAEGGRRGRARRPRRSVRRSGPPPARRPPRGAPPRSERPARPPPDGGDGGPGPTGVVSSHGLGKLTLLVIAILRSCPFPSVSGRLAGPPMGVSPAAQCPPPVPLDSARHLPDHGAAPGRMAGVHAPPVAPAARRRLRRPSGVLRARGDAP